MTTMARGYSLPPIMSAVERQAWAVKHGKAFVAALAETREIGPLMKQFRLHLADVSRMQKQLAPDMPIVFKQRKPKVNTSKLDRYEIAFELTEGTLTVEYASGDVLKVDDLGVQILLGEKLVFCAPAAHFVYARLVQP